MKVGYSYLICVFLLFYAFDFQAQNIEVRLDWQQPKDIQLTESESVLAPSFDGAMYDLSLSNIPRFVEMRQPSQPNVELELVQVVTGNLSAREAALLRGDAPSNSWNLSYEVKFQRGKPLYVIAGNAIRRSPETGNLEKIERLVFKEIPTTAEARRNKTNTFATSSVLSVGSWYRISVSRSGVFKITPDLLQELGAGTNLNSANIRVYGNGGGMLPERGGDFRYDDLEENALFMNDGGDGVFNGNDFAVFYAKGPHEWRYNAPENRFEHIFNIYDNRAYYYITIDNGPGKRMQQLPDLTTTTPTYTTATYDDYDFIEDDRVNLLKTGRQWFGDLFDFRLSYNYSFEFSNIDVTTPAELRMSAIARSTSGTVNMLVTYNNAQTLVADFNNVTGSDNSPFVTRTTRESLVPLTSNVIPLNVTFNNQSNPSATAWMDWIAITVRRNLVYQNRPIVGRDRQAAAATGVSRFVLTRTGGGQPLRVLDVTDHLNSGVVVVNELGNGSFEWFLNNDTLRQFAVFDLSGNNIDVPRVEGSVPNQNLHALTDVEMVIVSHPNFLSEANRLADFHRSEGLEVAVVTNQQVYNEFSSGAQDITAIRDMMRMLYERGMDGNDSKLKYLLLFGRASYDYKNRIQPNHNFVPIYQTNYSFDVYGSFSTDDYFGALDDNEGVFVFRDVVDLGVGRLTAINAAEARTMVDKIIRYASSSEAFGSWRNRLLFVADDVDAAWEDILIGSAENVATQISQNYPYYNIEKVYLDAFEQISSAGSQRYPDARAELFRKVNAGNLITTFIGHGGPTGWASERVLTMEDINGFQNENALPLFITITCDFSRVDDPDRVSAGERLLANSRGGAIGLISTTRIVFVQPAVAMSNAVFDTLFTVVDGRTQTLGDIIRTAKNTSGVIGNPNRGSFSLLGDPALRLVVPPLQVNTDSINGLSITSFADTVTALSKMRVVGHIANQQNQIQTGFNGILEPIVFDKEVIRQTLVNDGVGSPIPFPLRDNVIYRGQVTVTEGRFAFEFLVPLDISFNFDFGRISYYGSNDEIDAAGFNEDFIIGGINPNPPEDNEGPIIHLFMNDESFVSGGITDQNPNLLALVSDSSGINTVGTGIGRDITAILDDDLNQSFILNDFYTADLDSYQSGRIFYPFFNIPEGPHNVRLRVWDVFNNPSEADLDFVVASSASLALKHVLNYPNPFTTYTEFHFEHNRAGQPLDVQVQVFTVSGKLVKTINQQVLTTGNRVSEIQWDGLDDFGSAIGKGTYVYRLRVKAVSDDAYAEEYEKLVILR
ncbi:MAG: type IX secretion system sortase PorU [Schleiferiaceae bacterium]|nr:type IX secretion system sortase PorU [Schleiferiaceae bacterium]